MQTQTNAERKVSTRLMGRVSTGVFLMTLLLGVCFNSLGQSDSKLLPESIQKIMAKSQYSAATWGLRVVDATSGQVIYNLNSKQLLFTGSVRKLFSVGVTLNQLGPGYQFKTPVFKIGKVSPSGNLQGNLVLVAKGDITMGGRDNGDGTIAITDLDHCDANALGSAILTKPNVLGGLDQLAAQVAASGIKKISGDVIIDDRLFKILRVPNQLLLITPISINDNRIDVTILPTLAGQPALIDWRPRSAAFTLTSDVRTVQEGDETKVELKQARWNEGPVTGQIAYNYQPPLGTRTLVQTFRTDLETDGLPELTDTNAAFARTTFIEALKRAGVTVTAPSTGLNPSDKLPPRGSYRADDRVAQLVSAPYSQCSKLILKVSHNLGANMSLMRFGLANGVRTMPNALAVERTTLINKYGLNAKGFDFPTNGSGSPDSRASTATTADLLTAMKRQTSFPFYFESLPIMGVDGSLAEIGTDSPARGKVFAKTGTYIDQELTIKAMTLAGYINAESGRQLAYALFVNNAGTFTPGNTEQLINIFQDEAEISTIIQQLN